MRNFNNKGSTAGNNINLLRNRIFKIRLSNNLIKVPSGFFLYFDSFFKEESSVLDKKKYQ
jgi:hypothetical protein